MLNRPFSLTIFNILGRILNFFLYFVIANKFGANQSTDWFFFVYSIIYFFVGIFFYATENALVPAWHRFDTDERQLVFNKAFRLSIYGTIVITGVVFLSGFILAPNLGIFLPLDIKGTLVILLLLIFQPSIAFLSSLSSSFLQYEQKYFLPTIHLSLRTVGVLAVLFFPGCDTIFCLALAYLIGEVFRLCCFYRNSFFPLFFKKVIQKKSDSFGIIYRNVGWMTVVLTFTVINPVVDLAMVGKLGYGSVSLVEYAGRLRGIPVLALGGVLVYLLGEWSYQHHHDGKYLYWKQVYNVFWRLIFFVIVAVITLIATQKIWIPIVFFSNKFTFDDLHHLQELLFWYFPGVPLLAGSLILSRVILVMQKTQFLAIVAIVGSCVNVLLNVVFLQIMGLKGVAFSTTIVDTVVCIAYYVIAKKLLNKSASWKSPPDPPNHIAPVLPE